MSSQPNAQIQRTFTPEEQQNPLPTETHTDEQAFQELSDEQAEDTAGDGIGTFVINKIARKMASRAFRY